MIKIENAEVLGWEHAIRGHTDFKVTKAGDVIGKRGKRMTGTVDRHGYREVCLSENGKVKRYLVHRLVLSTFNPVENMDKLDVNHKDGNKLNNSLDNLEWCTRSENVKHSYKNGLQNNVGGVPVYTKEEKEFIKNNLYESPTKLASIMNRNRETIRRYQYKFRKEVHI